MGCVPQLLFPLANLFEGELISSQKQPHLDIQ